MSKTASLDSTDKSKPGPGRNGIGLDKQILLALNKILFTVYLYCCRAEVHKYLQLGLPSVSLLE